MSFDEIKVAVLALPKDQQMELLQAIDNSIVDDDELSDEQKTDLLDRIREHDANPEEGEDAFVVLKRLRQQLHAARPTTVESK